jgi:hypothetical protein
MITLVLCIVILAIAELAFHSFIMKDLARTLRRTFRKKKLRTGIGIHRRLERPEPASAGQVRRTT